MGIAVRVGSKGSSLLASSAGQYAFYRFGNLAINVWTAQPTGAAVEVLAELTVESRKSCLHGISSIHLLAYGIGLPTNEARAALRDISTRHGDHIAAVGVVLHGDGFWASAVRSALSGILLVGPKAPFPLRLYGTAEELAAWLPAEHVRRTGSPLDAQTLLECIREAES